MTKKDTLTIRMHEDATDCEAQLWPKRPKAKTQLQKDLYSIDIIKLTLTNSRGQMYSIEMTPDEAQEISIVLSNAVYAYMMFGDKTIKRDFLDKKKTFTKKYAPKKKKVVGSLPASQK